MPSSSRRKRIVDLGERLGLHLNQRKLDVFLNIGLGAFARVQDFVHLAPRISFALIPDAALHFAQDLLAALLEHPLQIGIAGLVH